LVFCSVIESISLVIFVSPGMFAALLLGLCRMLAARVAMAAVNTCRVAVVLVCSLFVHYRLNVVLSSGINSLA
jgi:hypothetical protein